jgi:hypothetical protein
MVLMKFYLKLLLFLLYVIDEGLLISDIQHEQ